MIMIDHDEQALSTINHIWLQQSGIMNRNNRQSSTLDQDHIHWDTVLMVTIIIMTSLLLLNFKWFATTPMEHHHCNWGCDNQKSEFCRLHKCSTTIDHYKPFSTINHLYWAIVQFSKKRCICAYHSSWSFQPTGARFRAECEGLAFINQFVTIHPSHC